MGHSRPMVASQACAAGVPNPGLIANASAAMSVRFPAVAERDDELVLANPAGPQSPGWRSLKHSR